MGRLSEYSEEERGVHRPLTGLCCPDCGRDLLKGPHAENCGRVARLLADVARGRS